MNIPTILACNGTQLTELQTLYYRNCFFLLHNRLRCMHVFSFCITVFLEIFFSIVNPVISLWYVHCTMYKHCTDCGMCIRFSENVPFARGDYSWIKRSIYFNSSLFRTEMEINPKCLNRMPPCLYVYKDPFKGPIPVPKQTCKA